LQYTCMYLCMYACMYILENTLVRGGVECLAIHMYVFMYVCMYVYTYILRPNSTTHAMYRVLAAVFASWFCVLFKFGFTREDALFFTSSPLCLLRVFTSYLNFGS